MKRKSFVVPVKLTDAEKQLIRDFQPIYGFYIIINDIVGEDNVQKKTVFVLQAETWRELTDNVFIFGGILGELFRGRGLSALPKTAEKHYFSTPASENSSKNGTN